ncbi:MAG TPA: hypothetical protein VKZ77_04955 [Bacillaceae bacterium]|nr:hypothetical protein [Bacillaceae bacterium]
MTLRASRKLGTKILVIWLVLLVTFQGFYTPTSLAIEDGVSPETEVLEQEEELEVNLGDKRSVEVEIEEPETVEEVEEYVASKHLPEVEVDEDLIVEEPLVEQKETEKELETSEGASDGVEDEKESKSEEKDKTLEDLEKLIEERSTRKSPEDPTVVEGAKLTLGDDGRPPLVHGNEYNTTISPPFTLTSYSSLINLFFWTNFIMLDKEVFAPVYFSFLMKCI